MFAILLFVSRILPATVSQLIELKVATKRSQESSRLTGLGQCCHVELHCRILGNVAFIVALAKVRYKPCREDQNQPACIRCELTQESVGGAYRYT